MEEEREERKGKESRRGVGNSLSSGKAVPSSLAFPGMASDTRTMRRGTIEKPPHLAPNT